MSRKSKLNIYLQKLKDYYAKHQVIPNFIIVANIFGLTSKASVHNIFIKLTNLGYLTKQGNKYFPTSRFKSLPMFESIEAGFPSPASEENRFDIDIQDFLIINPNSSIFLKVRGNSMIEEGIRQGDFVIVDKSLKAKSGDIVVAVVDGEYTMKYLMQDQVRQVFLKAANPDYPDIYPKNELEIFGVVTGVFRKYGNK